MASSSKVQFKLDVLKQRALESVDFRIQRAQTHVNSFMDDDTLKLRVAEWRKVQEAKIANLFAQLGEGGIDDYRLSKFKLDTIPNIDRYDQRDAERTLASLQVLRTKIVAKADALVPDSDGNVALTSTQLAEFFGL